MTRGSLIRSSYYAVLISISLFLVVYIMQKAQGHTLATRDHVKGIMLTMGAIVSFIARTDKMYLVSSYSLRAVIVLAGCCSLIALLAFPSP